MTGLASLAQQDTLVDTTTSPKYVRGLFSWHIVNERLGKQLTLQHERNGTPLLICRLFWCPKIHNLQVLSPLPRACPLNSALCHCLCGVQAVILDTPTLMSGPLNRGRFMSDCCWHSISHFYSPCVQAVILDTPTPTSDPLNRGRLMSDIHMMVQHDGKERDMRQWETLLAAAGFTLSKIVQTRCIFCMVEAKPIKGWKPTTVIGTPVAAVAT
jgi:hypothetical protein